jgi:hypothetical protein
VPASKLDLSGKREVVAHEHSVADHESHWKSLVVAVSESRDKRVVTFAPVGSLVDLQETEVSLAVLGERVSLVSYFHAECLKGSLDLIDKELVRNRGPRIGWFWSSYAENFFPPDAGSSAVEREVQFHSA